MFEGEGNKSVFEAVFKRQVPFKRVWDPFPDQSSSVTLVYVTNLTIVLFGNVGNLVYAPKPNLTVAKCCFKTLNGGFNGA